MAQRALILSGSLGLGHDMIAAACAEALQGQGWDSRTLSSLSLLGRLSGALGERAFRRLISRPGLYDALHFAGLRPGGPVAIRMDQAAKRRMVPALRAELARAPADLLIAVFAAGASALAELGREVPERRTVVFCNDVTLHRLWVWEGINLFCVTSPAAAASVRRFLPEARVAVVRQPVRSQFRHVPSQAEARSGLEVPEGSPCALLIGGGWGLGPLAETATGLASAGVHVLAVAGSNQVLARRLNALAVASPCVHAFGLTDRMPELMAASDLVITPSGPTTCSEARCVGRQLLIVDVVPGHGRENLLHELELGGAEVCNPGPASVVASALSILGRLDHPAQQARVVPDWGAELIGALGSIGVDIG